MMLTNKNFMQIRLWGGSDQLTLIMSYYEKRPIKFVAEHYFRLQGSTVGSIAVPFSVQLVADSQVQYGSVRQVQMAAFEETLSTHSLRSLSLSRGLQVQQLERSVSLLAQVLQLSQQVSGKRASRGCTIIRKIIQPLISYMNTFKCSQPSSDELDLPPHCFFCSNEIGDFYPLTINKALSSKYCNSQASMDEEFIEALLEDAYIPERVMLQELQVWEDDTQNLKRLYASSQFQGKIKKISQFYSKTWDAPRIHGMPECKVYSNRIVCKREFQYRKANNLPMNYSSDDSEMHYPSRDRYSTILKSIKDLSFKTVRKQQKKEKKPRINKRSSIKKILNESQACQDLLEKLRNLTSHRIKTPVQFEVLQQSGNQRLRLDRIIEDFNKNQFKNLINLKLSNLRRSSKEKEVKYDFKKKDPVDYSHRKLSSFKTKQSHDKLQDSKTKIHKVQIQRKSNNNLLILTGNGKISNKIDLIKGLHTNLKTDRTKRSDSIKSLSKNKESSLEKIQRLHKIYDSPGKLSKVNVGTRNLSQPKLSSNRPDKGFSDSKLMSNRTRSISKKGLSAQKR